MELGIVMSLRCNASCGHCSTSCGPHRTEALDQDRIFRLITDAAALRPDEPLLLTLTGGEPFLDPGKLRVVIEHAASLGAEVACVTNAYWATSEDRAGTLLTDLRGAGLSLLAISVSRYHAEFVNRTRVRRALVAARKVGLRTVLKCAVTYADQPRDGVPVWLDFAELADELEIFAVMAPGHENAVLDEAELILEPGLPKGICPSSALVVSEDGTARVCGAAAPLSTFHSVGSIATQPLKTLAWRAASRGKYRALRDRGPEYFARAIVERGHGTRLRPAYASVCDLCSHIALDPTMASIAERVGEEYELAGLGLAMEKLSSIMRP